VAEVFGSVTTDPWDAPLVTLPDRDAVRDYLRARFVAPNEAERLADALAERGPLPLRVTKRGTLVLARRARNLRGHRRKGGGGCRRFSPAGAAR
jgi:hypothetical protein